MFQTLLSDRATIERKYHNPEETFNAFDMMNYHGYEYDPATGLDDAEIDAGLAELAKETERLPRPICKATLFAYVLDHTRIDVNDHDYFIGMYTWNRPISKYTCQKWAQAVRESCPKETEVWRKLGASGLIHGWLDFDHTVPDWESLTELGFPGILQRAEQAYLQLKQNGTLTEKQEQFYLGIKTEYEAILRFLDRLYQYALTRSGEKPKKVAACLKRLREGAPQNTYDVLQMIYIYFMLSESIDHYQVRSLGYGLDSTLYPYYCNDLQSGTFSKEEIGELLGYFLLQWSAIGNYWGQPFYLGGMNADGSTKVQELSDLILDVYDRLGLYNPKIQIKVNGSTPKDFICRALDMIRRGNTSIVFCNDDVITKCLMAQGYSYEKAVDSVISGCYEYKVKRDSIGIGVGYDNALKPVSLVFDNGFDVITKKQIGPKTGELDAFPTFEAFYRAYLTQLLDIANQFTDALDCHQTQVQNINPSLMFSATIPACVETLTDALDNGISNVTEILVSGLGTAVDALMVVKSLVYEQKETTLTELRDALHSDWVGYETLRAKAKKCPRRYGNGDPMADNYAAAIVQQLADCYASKRNSHGGRFLLGLHSARSYLMHGEKTIATPDGRKYGDETSKNASPTPGSDRNGITALIRSATTIDTARCTDDFCLDAMLHPTAVQGETGLEAFYTVLMTYMQQGGASIHFNLFDADKLRDAQEHPEQYQNLQVRICGWNSLWNNMDKKEQDAYIERAESI